MPMLLVRPLFRIWYFDPSIEKPDVFLFDIWIQAVLADAKECHQTHQSYWILMLYFKSGKYITLSKYQKLFFQDATRPHMNLAIQLQITRELENNAHDGSVLIHGIISYPHMAVLIRKNAEGKYINHL